MRADSRRILVVAPGSLVEQWRDELFEKFGLQFNVFSSALEVATPTGNPFEDLDHLIVRLDQMTRNEELQEKLFATSWDLVVFDEAHKLAAHFFGSKLEKTGRFILAEKLGARTRHLLLMTATPHSGKEEDFQLFLSLLDSDRFYGKFRDGVHKVDSSDLMRRMVKEELLKFDGTPLSALYEAVTSYVKEEMGKADVLKGPRKGSVGFALTALQRRLASSPEAFSNPSSAAANVWKSVCAKKVCWPVGSNSLPRIWKHRRKTTTTSAPRSGRNWRKNSPTRPQPLRPLLNSKRRSLFSVVSLSKPVAWWIQALIENGTSSRKFSRTIPTCAMQAAASEALRHCGIGVSRTKDIICVESVSSHAFVFHRDNTR